jgi:hypothetical protein
MAPNLSELVVGLTSGEFPMEYIKDGDSRRVLPNVASELGLKAIWYDERGLRVVLKDSHPLTDARLKEIREAVEDTNPYGVQKEWHRKWQGDRSQMPIGYEDDIPEGYARYNAETRRYEVEGDVPENQKGVSLDFWIPIGLCTLDNVRELGVQFPPDTGTHYVNGRVGVYTIKDRSDNPVVNIQREPIVFYTHTPVPHYRLSTATDRGEFTMHHSKLPPHNHPTDVNEFSRINDQTVALAQWIVDELSSSQSRMF